MWRTCGVFCRLRDRTRFAFSPQRLLWASGETEKPEGVANSTADDMGERAVDLFRNTPQVRHKPLALWP
jgi:hypothetical protein